MVIRTADLFSIATSGIGASNQLLTTTSNNIANVNTEGYVRERTSFVAQLTGGVGESSTERVVDIFAQNQLRRDVTQLGEFETYYNRSAIIDDVFAGEANSISAAMSRFFASMQTAADDPTSMAARNLVLAEANTLVGQIGTMAGFLETKDEELNDEMAAMIDEANSLIANISELNDNIRVLQTANDNDVPGALLNERDQAIFELAELVNIETREVGDGVTLVNLASGESLVLDDGSFNVLQTNGDPDQNYKSVELTSSNELVSIPVKDTELGGSIGGLLRYREEVLAPNQRELGQIAVALTESLNSQNNLGMDFDQQLGSDIFSIPTFAGLNYADNSDSSLSINGAFATDSASQITSADYQITIDAVTAGAPDTVDVTVALLNPDGSAITDTDGNAITQTFTGLEATNGTYVTLMDGLEVEFTDEDNYAVGDQFLLQPTKNIADMIEVSMTRPEDLALASPIRVESSLNNTGNASLLSTTVTNTFVDNTFADADASGFDGAGDIDAPGSSPTGAGGVGAPAIIEFTGSDSYEVQDSAGTVITTVTGVTSLDDLLAQASGTVGWPTAFSALNDYPGYDVSLEGVPEAGDVFTIGYNTDGLNDNRNGVIMGNLQEEDSMLLNNNGTGVLVSFHEAYSIVVSDIGSKTSSADISLQAAEALQSQSQEWYDSISGVSLDEEAANLVKFQQSYAAAARILSAAQETFNTILSVA